MPSGEASARSTSDLDWALSQLEKLPKEIELLTPSTWAEKKRYLPPSVTSMPGYYRFEVTPYMREIVDCFSIDSPIREVAVMKGVQLAYTTQLETMIGYGIDHVKTRPMMLVTADSELANLRIDANVMPMLQHSKLDHLIQSADVGNNRRTGKTRQKLEFQGGGYLVPLGAKNPNKARATSVWALLGDEIDTWVDTATDGDQLKVFRDRTAGYESIRKLFWGSTPTIEGQSKIAREYEKGDKRKYFVCCLGCGHSQELRWRNENPQTGEVTGITWETEPETGRLVPGSVRYLCEKCGHAHVNEDKTRLLDPANGAEWRPTATPVAPHVRSYHISALYSPVGMQSWEECVRKWLDAWDVENNKPRDLAALQVFYNNVLGVPYKLQGEKIRFEQVSPHRRQWYSSGHVPNNAAVLHAGGPIVALIATVDIQKDWMAVGVFGFTRGRRPFLIERLNLGNDPYNPEQNHGDTEQLDDPHTWGELRKIVESREYRADDGKRYRIALTLVDSGYRRDQVYSFVGEYASGVVAVKGRPNENDRVAFRHFEKIKAPMGILAYHLAVDVYKDRVAAALKHDWSGFGVMPEGHLSAPMDLRDAYLKELTVEVKRERVDATGKRIGWEWHRPQGSRNETLDLSVYALGGLDLLAFHTFPPDEKAGVYMVDWGKFFDAAEGHRGAPLFFEP